MVCGDDHVDTRNRYRRTRGSGRSRCNSPASAEPLLRRSLHTEPAIWREDKCFEFRIGGSYLRHLLHFLPLRRLQHLLGLLDLLVRKLHPMRPDPQTIENDAPQPLANRGERQGIFSCIERNQRGCCRCLEMLDDDSEDADWQGF